MKYLNLLLLVALFSCIQNANETKKASQKSTDSVQVNSKSKYLADPTNTLEPKIQKLELEYIVWGCACANWITPQDRTKYQKSGLSKHSIFIEPADTTKAFPDSIFKYNKNNIEVTGQFYVRENYPKGTFETEEKLEKARVFRYTKLSVILKRDN